MSICSVAKHLSLDPFWEDEAGYGILNAWRIVFILWPNTGTDSLVKKETRVGEGGEAEQVRQLGPTGEYITNLLIFCQGRSWFFANFIFM